MEGHGCIPPCKPSASCSPRPGASDSLVLWCAGAGLRWGQQASGSRATATDARQSSLSSSDPLMPSARHRLLRARPRLACVKWHGRVTCNIKHPRPQRAGPTRYVYARVLEELAGPRPRKAAWRRQAVAPLLLLLLAAAQAVGCRARRGRTARRAVVLPVLLPRVELCQPLHACKGQPERGNRGGTLLRWTSCPCAAAGCAVGANRASHRGTHPCSTQPHLHA